MTRKHRKQDPAGKHNAHTYRAERNKLLLEKAQRKEGKSIIMAKQKTYLAVKIQTKLSKNQMGNSTTLGRKKQNPFGGKS